METKVGMHLKSLSKSIFHIPTSSLKSHSPPLFSTHDTFCTFFNTQNMKSKHFWPIWSFGSLINGSNWISRLQTKFSSYISRKFTNYILLLSRIKALYWYLEGPPNKYSYQVWFLLSKHYWRKQNHVMFTDDHKDSLKVMIIPHMTPWLWWAESNLLVITICTILNWIILTQICVCSYL